MLQKVRDRIRAIDGASINVMTHITVAAILNDAEEFELRNALQPSRDVAIDATGDALSRGPALQSVQLALAEMRQDRASVLVTRYFPALDTDRLAWRLRATLALRNGELDAAVRFLFRLVELKLSSANDLSQWAWYARAMGQGLHARRALSRDRFPPAQTASQVSALANALQLLFRSRDYDRLLADAGDRITDNEELFPAAVAATLSGRSAPPPDVVAVDTIAVLRRQGNSGEQRMVWIADKAGPSSQPFTRVQRNEAWLAPLIGQSAGCVVTFVGGAFAGAWTVEQILPAAAGTQTRLMDWAVRQGISGGGVDSVEMEMTPSAQSHGGCWRTRRIRNCLPQMYRSQ